MKNGATIAARTATGAVGLHALAVLAVHLLEPQIDIGSGNYGATDSAWLVTLAYVAFATAWASMAVAFSRATSGGRLIRGAQLLFALATVSLALNALFPEAANPNSGSWLPRLSLVARPGLVLGVVLASFGLRREDTWKNVGGTLVLVSAAFVAVLVVTIAFLLGAGLAGYGQRALFLLAYIWVPLASVPLMRRGASGSPQPVSH